MTIRSTVMFYRDPRWAEQSGEGTVETRRIGTTGVHVSVADSAESFRGFIPSVELPR